MRIFPVHALAASLLVLRVPDNEPAPRLIPIARSGGSGTGLDRSLGEMTFANLWQSKLVDKGDSLSSVTDINLEIVAAFESAACSAEVRKGNR